MNEVERQRFLRLMDRLIFIVGWGLVYLILFFGFMHAPEAQTRWVLCESLTSPGVQQVFQERCPRGWVFIKPV
jgi:hypothetical protein